MSKDESDLIKNHTTVIRNVNIVCSLILFEPLNLQFLWIIVERIRTLTSSYWCTCCCWVNLRFALTSIEHNKSVNASVSLVTVSWWTLWTRNHQTTVNSHHSGHTLNLQFELSFIIVEQIRTSNQSLRINCQFSIKLRLYWVVFMTITHSFSLCIRTLHSCN